MPQQQQAPPDISDLFFPINGTDVSIELEQQTSDTTPLGVNVRAFEPTTQRARGGSRAGLGQYIPEQLPHDYVSGSRVIQHLQVIVDPSAQALGASFPDIAGGFPYLSFDVFPFEILGDGSWNMVYLGGSGFSTNKDKKRKFAQLVLQANNQSKPSGEEFTWAGDEYTILHGTLQPGDEIKSVTFRSQGAPADAAPGTYKIIPSNAVIQQVVDNKPYQILYKNGTMTVTPGVGITLQQALGLGFPIPIPNSGTVPVGTFEGQVLTGELIVVALRLNTLADGTDVAPSTPIATSVNDNSGNSYTQIQGDFVVIFDATGNNAGSERTRISLWYAVAQSDSPALQLTITYSGANPSGLFSAISGTALNYSGTIVSPFDGSSSNNGTMNNRPTPTPFSTGNIGIIGNNELLLVYAFSSSGGPTFVSPSGFIMCPNVGGSSFWIGYVIVPSSGDVDVQGTLGVGPAAGTTDQWAVIGASFAGQ